MNHQFLTRDEEHDLMKRISKLSFQELSVVEHSLKFFFNFIYGYYLGYHTNNDEDVLDVQSGCEQYMIPKILGYLLRKGDRNLLFIVEILEEFFENRRKKK